MIVSLLRKLFKRKPKKKHIPDDLLVDILCKLPVKSLVRFKAVHSDWSSLISAPEFCRRHLQYHVKRTGQKYGTIQAGNKHTLHPSLTLRIMSNCGIVGDHELVEIQNIYGKPVFDHYDYPKLFGCCNGLLLISLSSHSESFILWNPTLRQHRKIDRKDGYWSPEMYKAGLGYDSLNHNYKIVVAEASKLHKNSIDLQIYDLKKSSWKTRNYDFPYKFKLHNNTPVITLPNGILHWHVKRMANGQSVILCFDSVDEIFKEVPLPKNTYDFCFISSLDGCLCIGITESDFDINVWKMRKYGIKKSWIKLKNSFPNIDNCRRYLMPFGVLENNQVVMNLNTTAIAIFDVTSTTVIIDIDIARLGIGILFGTHIIFMNG
ncbi:F-box/kelch-repeat protein At3g23880-like [Mercurialis annua]|uniref:F-box/kelch-repeat protein At3g23880-like n=1 Tax=Mercurialis annua TaxID=3986 RepID=UPI002160DC44|nr:F-box/kelch-repeat protein At3g23880-like [Mercurialis annua]